VSESGVGVPALRLEGVTRAVPGREEPVVSDLTLEVGAGELVALAGPEGAGKSTVLRLVNRLVEPTAGTVALGGEPVAGIDPDRLRRRIGYLPPGLGLFPHMTVAQNVAVTPRLLGWSKERMDERVDELLGLLGMEPKADRGRHPRELTPAQAARVGIARALAAEPPVALLDDPLAGLERTDRDLLAARLARVQARLRTTLLVAMRDPAEAAGLASRVVVMKRGKLVADGPSGRAEPEPQTLPEDVPEVGSALARLALARVGDLEPGERITAMETDPDGTADALRRSGGRPVLLLDIGGRPVRWVRARDLEPSEDGPGGTPATVVDDDVTLQGALDAMLTAGVGAVAVVDETGAYRGVLDFDLVAAALREEPEEDGPSAARRGGRRRRRRGTPG
jgi:osmoprotectant transport system ATP-binding protein